jgi:hypothetical protein
VDKYGENKDKNTMIQKLEQISSIKTQIEARVETEVKKKVKTAKIQRKQREIEEDLIQKTKMEYASFISHYKSAMPKTEEERLQDMSELKTAISMLESFENETYEEPSKKHDAGLGIFYDNMSRRFLSIINEYNLDTLDFIPIQRIKYHTFQHIKNITNDDILPILNVMENTHLIRNLIEINPQFHIIVFNDGEKLELSLAEKVLLSFAYEEDVLTTQKLIELTDWKEDYAIKIIGSLIDKGLIKILDEKIIVENFGTLQERRSWDKRIGDKIKEEAKKEEEKRIQQLKTAAKLRERLEEVEGVVITEQAIEQLSKKEPKKIKFKQKPTIKNLPAQKEGKNKQEQEIKDKDDLIGAMEALDVIMPAALIEKTEFKKDTLIEESSHLEELIPEKILSYHEKYTLINGGLSQYEKIKQFMKHELGEISDNLMKSMLEQLKQLQLIHESYKIGDYEFYLFNELKLNEDEKKFIEFAINKKPMLKDDFVHGLEWDEEIVLKTMKTLQEKNILRIEKSEIIIPGIIQKK